MLLLELGGRRLKGRGSEKPSAPLPSATYRQYLPMLLGMLDSATAWDFPGLGIAPKREQEQLGQFAVLYDLPL